MKTDNIVNAIIAIMLMFLMGYITKDIVMTNELSTKNTIYGTIAILSLIYVMRKPLLPLDYNKPKLEFGGLILSYFGFCFAIMLSPYLSLDDLSPASFTLSHFTVLLYTFSIPSFVILARRLAPKR